MIKFGPSGNDVLFHLEGHKSSVEAPAWIQSKGLSAYEYSFGQGVRIKDETACLLGEEAQKHGVSISVHAPYFVSFASPEPQKVENSFAYVLSSLKKLDLMKGTRCVIHTASCGKQAREDVLAQCRDRLTELAARMKEEGLGHLNVCPETMGKYSQIGTAEEIIDLCTIDPVFIPCFDFGHINCYMQGGLNCVDAYSKIIDYAFDRLDSDKVKNMHVHFSKIKYGAKGELYHLDLSDRQYGPEFEVFAEAIVKYGLTPTVICESADIMAQDAMKLRDIFLANKG